MTVNSLAADPWPGTVPAGVVVRPTRLGELMPVAARSAAEIAVELQRIEQVEGQLAAYRAELVAQLAVRRPDSADRQLGEPGAASPDWVAGPGREPVAGVSEFFADELAMVLNCSRTAATKLADASMLLATHLRGTWEALADGRLDWPRARALVAELTEPAGEVEPAVLAQVEAAVLPRARRLTIRGLQAAARAELLRRDAAASDRRRRRAQQGADVTMRPLPDGMAELSVFLPQRMAAAIRDTVDGYARLAKADGDEHRIGQLRVGALYDLVTRPWDTSRPPVTAHLTVLAPLPTLRAAAAGHDACAVAHLPLPHLPADLPADPPADPDRGLDPARRSDHACAGGPVGGPGCGEVAPGDLDGQPITAAHLRELLEELDALCPGGLQAPAGGRLDIALTDPVSGALRAAVTRTELERLARRGCPDHPGGDCGCPLLDRPPPTDRYRPSAAQHRFICVRDRTCRHPGCRNRAAWADLDHVVPHSDGEDTACENLCCLCRRHHRLKTFAAGWSFTMTDDGVLTVTTPSGVTRVTRPPGMDVVARGTVSVRRPAYAGLFEGSDAGADACPADDPPPF
ncbi:DUF222 domain-containing protein [Blastococcus saxobsidens]|uniref:DUF222 domain-containing protein n=1 Tax=Blastococcus saxobsidens TaxID=138336 RepID=UPI0013D1DCCF